MPCPLLYASSLSVRLFLPVYPKQMWLNSVLKFRTFWNWQISSWENRWNTGLCKVSWTCGTFPPCWAPRPSSFKCISLLRLWENLFPPYFLHACTRSRFFPCTLSLGNPPWPWWCMVRWACLSFPPWGIWGQYYLEDCPWWSQTTQYSDTPLRFCLGIYACRQVRVDRSWRTDGRWPDSDRSSSWRPIVFILQGSLCVAKVFGLALVEEWRLCLGLGPVRAIKNRYWKREKQRICLWAIVNIEILCRQYWWWRGSCF